jgi:glycosyltransferase involved in cell wall biosynthesis
MTENNPKVSVGLAVFNGEKYLREAIDSILAQTFTDFELIISDNDSTDRTEEICREYAAKESRIRYYRNAKNIGGANNENRTFMLSRGQYFRWAAHDDLIAPELIEKCVEVLDNNPSVVLCYPMTVGIDEQGNHLYTIETNRGSSGKASERFRSLALKDHGCEIIYGLIRADVLRKTRLQLEYTDSDRTLLCELSLYGKFHEILEPLFYKRHHSKNQYFSGLSWYTRVAWFDPELVGKIVIPPSWNQFFDFYITISRVPFPVCEKLRCYLFMFVWFFFYIEQMLKEIGIVLYLLLQTAERREELYKQRMNWL